MTKKTLKDILGEGYLDDMQTGDTVNFVKKHTIDNEPVKKDKKVGTDNDEVFKASNVKKVTRAPHHGHEPEKSKDVYEASVLSKDMHDKLSSMSKQDRQAQYNRHINFAMDKSGRQDLRDRALKAAKEIKKKYLNEAPDSMSGDVTSPSSMGISAPSYAVPTPKKKPDDLKTNAVKPISGSSGTSTVTKTGPQSSSVTRAVEEAQIEEKLSDEQKKGIRTALGPKTPGNEMRKGTQSARALIGLVKKTNEEAEPIEEKTLTPAEMKKRKEIADAIKREHPEYSDEKKMKIATAQAIKVAEEKEENDDSWYTHNQIHGNKGISREDWKNGWRMNSKGERVKMKSEETSMDSYLSAISRTGSKSSFNEASTEFGKQFAAAADAYRKGEGSDVAKIGGKDIAIKYADPASQKKLESDRAEALKAKAKPEAPKAEVPKPEAPKAIEPAKTPAPQTPIEKKGSDAVASAQSNQFTSRPIGGSGIGIGTQTKGQIDSAIRNVVGGDKAPATTFGPRANKTPPAASTSQPKDTSRVPSSDDSSSSEKPATGNFTTSIFKLQKLPKSTGQNVNQRLKTFLSPDVQKNSVSGRGGVVYHNKTIPSSRANESVDEAVWDNPSPNKTPEKLTPAEKAKAKARAKAAGRPYPNLVDNMAVAKESVEEQEMDNELSEALKTASSRMNHYHTEIGKLLKGIATGLHQMKKTADQHKNWNGEKGPNWGHVGTLSDYHKQLSDLHDRIHQQGEYMTPAAMKEDISHTDAEMARTLKNQARTSLNIAATGDVSKARKKKEMRNAVKEYGLSQKYAKKAVTGMDEEVEQIDELDLETYKSYNKASKASGEETLDKLSKGGFKKQMFKKYLNRKGGQERAVRLAGKKVLGEEQVDEAEMIESTHVVPRRVYLSKVVDNEVAAFPVHKKIARLEDGEKTSFRDKNGAKISAHRMGDKLHIVKEESEQIDEISKDAALNYIGASSYDKSSHASDIGAINQIARTTGTNDAQRKEREALSKKHGNRSLGIQRAAAKLAGKGVKVPATEEVEQPRLTSEAIITLVKTAIDKKKSKMSDEAMAKKEQ